MDSKKLIEAVGGDGNVEMLRKLLEENPTYVAEIPFVSVSESLLHIATKSGNLSLVQELLKHNYKLGRELNKDGFRPLDIASILGNVEIVKELIKTDPEICLLRGKDRKTALHHAASRGRFMVIDELASFSLDSLKDTTVHGETALHLAVKSYQFDAFKALVKWVEIHGLQEIINWGDYNGNTVLHLAASTKQYECLEFLLKESSIRATLSLNAKNGYGLTAIDVFDIVMENAEDLHTRRILEQAGVVKAKANAAASNTASPNNNPDAQNQENMADYHQSRSSLDWIKYFKFQAHRDSPSDTRNVLLIVAVLIATVTFQAGIQPPSRISANYLFLFLFLFSNTLALSASTNIILYLTGGFPFQRDLVISMVSLMFAYAVTVGISEGSGEQTVIRRIGNTIIQLSFMLPLTLTWQTKYLKNAWERSSSFFRGGSRLPVRS